MRLLNRKTNYRPFSLTSFNCPYTNTEIRLLSSVKNYNYMRFNIDISTLLAVFSRGRLLRQSLAVLIGTFIETLALNLKANLKNAFIGTKRIDRPVLEGGDEIFRPISRVVPTYFHSRSSSAIELSTSLCLLSLVL